MIVAASVVCVPKAVGEQSNLRHQRIPQWSDEAETAWWRAHATPESWVSGAGRIHAALLELQDRDGLGVTLSNPDFAGWVRHLHWLSLFPGHWQENAYFRRAAHQDVYRTLSLEPDLPGVLLSALAPEDNAGKALEILCRLYHRDPDQVREYANLAVALAVVFDQPLPRGWPHPYVSERDLRLASGDPWSRFKSLVAANRRDRLVVDPRQLSVRELTFVVDARLDSRGLRFARGLSVDDVEQLPGLYERVQYRSERIRNADYVWPHGAYRLSEIARRGGICADRAFFAAQVGKACGVPTVMFLGQGRNGTHAWVGFRERPGHWRVDVSRYQSYSLPMGRAFDPQTGRSFTDVGMQALVYGRDPRTASAAATSLVEWALLNPGAPFYRDLLVMARGQSPDWAEPSHLEARWIDQVHPPLAQQEAFWRELILQFRDDPGLSFEGKKRLLLVFEAAGNDVAADRLREEILAENRWKRFDLAIGLAADAVFELMENQAWAEAEQAFEREMRRFRARSGGHLFYNLLLPYAQRALQHGQTDLAAHAAGYLNDGFFSVRPGTILDNDLQLLHRRIDAFASSGNGQR